MLTRFVDGCTCLTAPLHNYFTLRDLSKGIVSSSSPGYNQTVPWNIFTLQHGGELGILNAAPASFGSANLITFEYQRGKKAY